MVIRHKDLEADGGIWPQWLVDRGVYLDLVHLSMGTGEDRKCARKKQCDLPQGAESSCVNLER